MNHKIALSNTYCLNGQYFTNNVLQKEASISMLISTLKLKRYFIQIVLFKQTSYEMYRLRKVVKRYKSQTTS